MMDARQAIEQISELADAIAYGESEANALAILDICAEVLNKPPRNCDVGTAEEQWKRFYEKFCGQSCFGCPLSGLKRSRKADCIMEWAQMPYEAEEKGEGK